MKTYQYFFRDADFFENGVIRVSWSGTNGHIRSAGVYDVSPDSSDYKFWQWLMKKQKRRWYQFWSLPGPDEQAIAKFRQDYEKEQTQGSA